MATFHCYCALCSCSLGSYELGSKKPEALRRRRARVARRIYWRRRGHSCYYETEDEEEEEKEERLRRMPETDSGIAEEEEDDDDESERTSYDPELLDRDGLHWLDLLGALGLHCSGSGAGPDAPRYFIADLDYDDCNLATISPHDDPDTPREEPEVYCYYGPTGGTIVLPFHWGCMDILCRIILGHPAYDDLDKKALYDAMSQGKAYCTLNLPYGDITGSDQDWQSVPGEEYSVTNPLIISDLDRREVKRFCKATEDQAKTSLDLSSKVQNDPFNLLPQEISDMILDYLPGMSVAALLSASWTMHARTRYSEFWKRRLHRNMPWIWDWEWEQFLEGYEDSSVNYKGLYIYLDEVTRPRYGMRAWLALANRRRIWGACEVLAERYHRVKQEQTASG